jgi:Acyl-CoA dehydrogenase, C-terminal domain
LSRRGQAWARAPRRARCEVVFDGLRVPEGDRVGEEGRGFRYLLDGLNAHARLHAAGLVVREAAWRIDRGLPAGEQANTAKFLAAEAAFAAADAAVQTHGGFGYAREYHVERYFREARLQRIAPIPQEMVLNYLAEHVLGAGPARGGGAARVLRRPQVLRAGPGPGRLRRRGGGDPAGVRRRRPRRDGGGRARRDDRRVRGGGHPRPGPPAARRLTAGPAR